jgi:hypothetical protein
MGIRLNLVNGIYKKLKAIIILSDISLDLFSPTLRAIQILPTFI